MVRVLKLLILQIRDEQRAFWRNRAAAIFTYAFVILFLIFEIILFGNQRFGRSQLDIRQLIGPSLIGFGLLSSTFTSLAMLVSLRKENKIFKLIKRTPISPSIYVLGLVGSSVLNSVFLALLGFFILYLEHFSFSHFSPGYFILWYLGGSICFSTLGIALATYIPNVQSAPGIVNLIAIPLVFISGGFSPFPSTSLLTKISEYLFVRPILFELTFYANEMKVFPLGPNTLIQNIVIVGAWTLFGLRVATKGFKNL